MAINYDICNIYYTLNDLKKHYSLNLKSFNN